MVYRVGILILLWYHAVGCPCIVRLSVWGKHPRFRGYFWAILDIIIRYFKVYSV